ncbi:PilZ domain-containing protein [Pseudoalteromonas xiamenensis]|uniref:PilZ domain-containing protein n=1 Tax=Pseudoalteromonas xiamenensis TaxID=882626 RepID=UPI0027E56CAA|nr:PilZ domain-containing protein [Pseudoalteromonas xiamenensis]WMN60110.1 PilZ domain-containing protein [Pseudoalteromonas xiamenensis]
MSDKQTQFESFFQIEESNRVNLYPVAKHEVPLTQDELEASIPALFRLANEVNELNISVLRPLRSLGDVAEQLAVYLQAQSRKIDLIMSHILSTEQSDDDTVNCDSYGGGGIKITLDQDFELGQHFRTKIFLYSEAAAIFCFTEVIAKAQTDKGTQYTLLFSKIRDTDQELIVRASLHAQTRQLKKRQSDKNETQNS